MTTHDILTQQRDTALARLDAVTGQIRTTTNEALDTLRQCAARCAADPVIVRRVLARRGAA